jgi:hypothetical protein
MPCVSCARVLRRKCKHAPPDLNTTCEGTPSASRLQFTVRPVPPAFVVLLIVFLLVLLAAAAHFLHRKTAHQRAGRLVHIRIGHQLLSWPRRGGGAHHSRPSNGRDHCRQDPPMCPRLASHPPEPAAAGVPPRPRQQAEPRCPFDPASLLEFSPAACDEPPPQALGPSCARSSWGRPPPQHPPPTPPPQVQTAPPLGVRHRPNSVTRPARLHPERRTRRGPRLSLHRRHTLQIKVVDESSTEDIAREVARAVPGRTMNTPESG